MTQGILETAEKQAANLIVMCTHGRLAAGRWIMGSVADRVLCVAHPGVVDPVGMPEV